MQQIKKWETWGIVFSIIVGSLLHFAYGWSSDNKIVAFFGAVNESTWEHLKLAFWPTLIIIIIEYFIFSKEVKNFCFAAFVKLISMPLIIVGLFYAWLAVLPDNFVWDISIFVVAVIVGYIFSYKIMISKKVFEYKNLSALLILLLLIMYASFTYCPPKNFLFRDPNDGGYGIKTQVVTTQIETADSSDDRVDGMKVYQDKDFSFSYPVAYENFVMKYIDDPPPAYFHADYHMTDNTVNKLYISIYPLGYKYDNIQFKDFTNTTQINLNITLEDFQKIAPNYSKVTALKKLSDKSLIVFSTEYSECYADPKILVFAPIKNSTKYSNIVINIQPNELKNMNPDPEDMTCPTYDHDFKALADGIITGTAKPETMEIIATAQAIAESANGI